MPRIIGGGRKDYERVAVDEWIHGIIEETQYDENHEYQTKEQDDGPWVKKTAPFVRFKFKLVDYEFPHYSRWMKCSTHKKSNFYSKYLKYLCPNVDCEDKAIDIDKLQGIEVKTMWENQDNDWQHVSQIRGVNADLNIIASGQEVAGQEAQEEVPPVEAEPEGEEVPF